MATRPRTPALETVVMVFLRSRQAGRRLSLPSGPYTDEELNRRHSGGRNMQQEHALRSTALSLLLSPFGAKFLAAELPSAQCQSPKCPTGPCPVRSSGLTCQARSQRLSATREEERKRQPQARKCGRAGSLRRVWSSLRQRGPCSLAGISY